MKKLLTALMLISAFGLASCGYGGPKVVGTHKGKDLYEGWCEGIGNAFGNKVDKDCYESMARTCPSGDFTVVGRELHRRTYVEVSGNFRTTRKIPGTNMRFVCKP